MRIFVPAARCSAKRKRIEEAGLRPDVPVGRVPRIARLMALAIRVDRLIRAGHVSDYAELARMGHVSRARVTQIMNLNLLAPDIQEDLLFLPRVERGHDPIREHAIRPIAAMFDWRKQRKEWRRAHIAENRLETLSLFAERTERVVQEWT